jgi:hypothetical protein
VVTWSSGEDSLGFDIRRDDGNKVGEADTNTIDMETLLWAVDPSPGPRYLYIEKKNSGGVAYTVALSGN